MEQVISNTDLTDLADRPTHLLSYGQKKRVAIAGVLVMEPEVIIADEPTAGLDPEMTTRVLDLLDTLHRTGRSIVISTHDVELALAWADHVIVLRQGRLLAEGRPDAVLADDPLLREARLPPAHRGQRLSAATRQGAAPAFSVPSRARPPTWRHCSCGTRFRATLAPTERFNIELALPALLSRE